jgi:hypothetical protein
MTDQADPTSQYTVDPRQIVELVQQDPTGALLVRNAVQQCVIEQQQSFIEQLKRDLVEKSQNGRSDEASDAPASEVAG